jgi:hypothetical protein
MRNILPMLVLVTSALRAQDTQFGIDFLARGVAASPASIGHAWICLYHGPDVGPPVRECVGFFPQSNAQVLLGLRTAANYPAVVNEGDNGADPNGTATIGFYGAMTQAQYQAVRAIVAQWKGRGYNIAWQNCADFVDAVALTIGLTEPSGSGPRYPPTLIAALGASNPGRLSAIPRSE